MTGPGQNFPYQHRVLSVSYLKQRRSFAVNSPHGAALVYFVWTFVLFMF
jgi:hypothetical protein